jgi:hypothetical protein
VDVNVAAASICDGLSPLHLAAEGGAVSESCLAYLLQVPTTVLTNTAGPCFSGFGKLNKGLLAKSYTRFQEANGNV